MTEQELYQKIKSEFDKSGIQYVLSNLFLDTDSLISYEFDIDNNQITFFHVYSEDVFHEQKDIVIKSINEKIDIIDTLVKQKRIVFINIDDDNDGNSILQSQILGVDKTKFTVVKDALDYAHIAILKKVAFAAISSVN